MAGGTWETQNKVRPGVYINFKTDQAETLAIGERGVVAICEPLSWGPVGQIQAVAAGADTTPFVGYDITEQQARFLREIFKGTNRTGGPREVLLYRPPASSLTATAKYPGKRGNDITIVITALTEPEDAFNVQTVVGGVIRDAQQAKQVSDLAANGWVTWSGEGAVTATTASALTGGQDGTVQTAAYSSFLTALEPYQFDVLIYDGEESAVLTAFQSFVERMVEDEGKYCQLVTAEMASPDSRFVINNISGAVMDDGTTFTPQQVCWWLGGGRGKLQPVPDLCPVPGRCGRFPPDGQLPVCGRHQRGPGGPGGGGRRGEGGAGHQHPGDLHRGERPGLPQEPHHPAVFHHCQRPVPGVFQQLYWHCEQQ